MDPLLPPRYTGHVGVGSVSSRGVPPLLAGLQAQVGPGVSLEWALGANCSGHPEASRLPPSHLLASLPACLAPVLGACSTVPQVLRAPKRACVRAKLAI